MRFWILLAAVVGYHVQDLWIFLALHKFDLAYPYTILAVASCPGWFIFRSHLMIGLMNALVYGFVALVVGLGVRHRQRLRRNPA